MLKNLRQHESKALSSNGSPTLQIPAYAKIHNVILAFSKAGGVPASKAEIIAEIGKIRFTINGIDYVNCTAKQLFATYEQMSNRVSQPTLDNGTIELNVGRLLFPDGVKGKDLFGIGTKDVATIQVQITCKTITDVISVTAYTSREPVTSAILGTVAKLIEFQQTYNSTGEHTVDTLPRNADEDYLMVTVDQGEGAAAVVSHGECTVNSNNMFDKIPANVNASFCSSNSIKQASNTFIYDFTNGTTDDRLPMVEVKDLRFKTTFSTAPGANGYSMLALMLTNVPRASTNA